MRTLALTVVLATSVAAAPEPHYVLDGAFGPAEAGFPWHCRVSRDGKWISFVDGASGRVSIWDFETRKEAWSVDEPCGTHRGAFTRNSRRFVTVAKRGLLMAGLEGRAWKSYGFLELGFVPKISKRQSPAPMMIHRNGRGSMFVEQGANYSVKDAGIKDVTERGEVPYSTEALAGGPTAFAKLKPFSTTVLFGNPAQRVIRAIVLAGSPDDSLWLVAKKPKFDFKRASLEVFDTAAKKGIAKFTISGGRPRPLLVAQFSPDSTLLVTVEGKGEIVLRDARTAKPVQRIKEYHQGGQPLGATFTPDGAFLITGGQRSDGKPATLLWKRAAK